MAFSTKRSKKLSREKPQSSRSKAQSRENPDEDDTSEEDQEDVAKSSSRSKRRDESVRFKEEPGTQYASGAGSSAGSTYDVAGVRMDRLSLGTSQSGSKILPTEVSVKNYGDGKVVTTRDRATGLSSTWSIGPKAQIAIRGPGKDDDDPKKPRGTSRRFKGYEISRDPVRDYVLGRVIEVLMVPPPPGDNTGGLGLTSRTETHFIEGTRVQRRRYVVITPMESGREGFAALPIKTYNQRGVEGQTKWHHCIIYTERPPPHRNPPLPTTRELPQRLPSGQLETGMQTHAILVETYDRGEALDPMSRLDFFDAHDFVPDVDHVKLFGRVHPDSRGHLHYQYRAVRAGIDVRVGVTPETPIPIEQVRTWHNSLYQRAVQLGLTPPRALTEQQVQYLASSHDARVQYQNRVQQGWANEQQRRRDAPQRAEQGDSDEGTGDDTDEDEDDDD